MANFVVFLEVISANFNFDTNIHGADAVVDVLRWQFPLLHDMLRIAYAAQGLTPRGGGVFFLRRSGGLTDDDWGLALYMMLSRAQKLSNMLLIGFSVHVEDLRAEGRRVS